MAADIFGVLSNKEEVYGGSRNSNDPYADYTLNQFLNVTVSTCECIDILSTTSQVQMMQQNPEKLIEMEQEAQLKRKKRSLTTPEYYTYDESDFVYPISSIKDRVVLCAYLSKSLTQKIKSQFIQKF